MICLACTPGRQMLPSSCPGVLTLLKSIDTCIDPCRQLRSRWHVQCHWGPAPSRWIGHCCTASAYPSW